MITDGPKLWLIRRIDGKEVSLRKHRATAKFDAKYQYQNRDWYDVEPVSACALLWWSPRVKARTWEEHEL